MFEAVQIAPDIYWVGAIDWNERNFHGYTTDRGSTYNAYLIMDEKITLVDTVKPGFGDEMTQRIASVVDPAKIDVIISNHSEKDHSGELPLVHSLAPTAPIYTSAPYGEQILTAMYGDLGYVPVKSGDTLNIGVRDLVFQATVMVHWPDNMVTYSPHDRILFSNDAFGQHLASSQRFDDEMDEAIFLQARKYFANIVMPYCASVRRALDAVAGLDLAMIAPCHGLIWRSEAGLARIMELYQTWAQQRLDEYALVVYDSMWHSTEAMANTVAEAFTLAGVPVRLLDLKVNHISDIMAEVLTAKYLAVGSPTLNATMMASVAAFLCYLEGLNPKGKNKGEEERVGLAFGSYGWASAGPDKVAAGLEAAGLALPFGTYARAWTPDADYLDDMRQDLVAKIAAYKAGELVAPEPEDEPEAAAH